MVAQREVRGQVVLSGVSTARNFDAWDNSVTYLGKAVTIML